MSCDQAEFFFQINAGNCDIEQVFVVRRYMNLSSKKPLKKLYLYSTQECDRCYFGNVVTVGANKAANNHVHTS